MHPYSILVTSSIPKTTVSTNTLHNQSHPYFLESISNNSFSQTFRPHGDFCGPLAIQIPTFQLIIQKRKRNQRWKLFKHNWYASSAFTTRMYKQICYIKEPKEGEEFIKVHFTVENISTLIEKIATGKISRFCTFA